MSDEQDLLGFSKEKLEDLKTASARSSDSPSDGSKKGRYKHGSSRFQSGCVGLCLDDRVDRNSPVRLIDFLVDQMNMERLGFTRATRHVSPGQPAYDPACLFKLYLYGYMNQVRSSRRLARECKLNIEVMWLLEELTPGYRAINTFRADNPEALTKAHEEFVLLCEQLSLIDGKRISIDGSHFKGNVSAKSFITAKGLKKAQAKAKAQAAAWLETLEKEEKKEADKAESTVDVEQIKEALKQLNAEIDSTQEQLDELDESGRTQRSRTEPDARLLRKRSKAQQGYNVQIATDHKHYLIVGDALTTDSSDINQLHPIAEQVKQRFGLSQLEVVADQGYYNPCAIGACMEAGITPYVAMPPQTKSKDRDSAYARTEFVYDIEQDVYRCPANQLLRRAGKTKPRYRNREACANCESRAKCIVGKTKFREIWPINAEEMSYEQLLAEHHQLMQQPEADQIYAERQGAVEHPFGTLKRRAGHSHFHIRGKEKVSGEWSLMVLCYNFTRVMNILGFDKFKEILEELVRKASRVLARLQGQFKRLLALETDLLY